jgi:hypothetical protein
MIQTWDHYKQPLRLGAKPEKDSKYQDEEDLESVEAIEFYRDVVNSFDFHLIITPVMLMLAQGKSKLL